MACVVALLLLSGRDRVRIWLGRKWISFGTVAILSLLLTGSWFSIRRAETVAYYTEARHALAVGDIDLGIE